MISYSNGTTSGLRCQLNKHPCVDVKLKAEEKERDDAGTTLKRPRIDESIVSLCATNREPQPTLSQFTDKLTKYAPIICPRRNA